VCADISIVALQEARERIGEHGLFVVCDVANLPFKPGAFDSAVSLHTIHHLPEEQHEQAYGELYRVLKAGGTAAVVNGWPGSRFMRLFEPLIRFSIRVQNMMRKGQDPQPVAQKNKNRKNGKPKGTFTERHDVAWINRTLKPRMPLEIHVWRSASVRFLRALIHPKLGGRWWLKLLYWLEERYPRYFAENGQYPIIVIQKPENNGAKHGLE